MRLYSGCGTRRLTSTTMVFAILVDTTCPTFSFLNPVACASAILFLRSRRDLPLPQNRQHPRAVLLQPAQLLQPIRLPHVDLKLETEELLFHFMQLILQIVIVEIAYFLRLHNQSPLSA